jgi:hypothetical protein
MARFLRGFILRNSFLTVCVLSSASVQTPLALAQHGGGGGHMGGGGGHMGGGGGHMGGGGGHMGGGGGHFSSGGHGASPRGFAPRTAPTTIRRPRGSPPPVGAGIRNPRFQQRPPRVVHRRVFFGPRFRRFRHGFNSFWWPIWWCPSTWGWGWGFNCYTWPSFWYGSGFGTDPPNDDPGARSIPSYAYPGYRSDEDRRDLTELYLKDGTVYDVTDYWLEDGKIHFRTREGSVEQVLGVDALDLQTTVDVNTRRGFRFVLRNEPAE